MRFADPQFFFLLFFLPLLFVWGKGGAGKIKFSNIDLFKKMKSRTRFHPRAILLLLRLLALILFVCALARPQSGKKFSEVTSEGVDIILAIDTSGSMQALDFKWEKKRVTRLEMVKKVVAEFVKMRPRDRLGLVVFGEEAYTQCPLTLDHGVVLEFLNKLEIGMAGDATGIGPAIGVSVNRMKELKSKSKVVVLLTDGRNNAGRIGPIKASQVAKTFEVKVYTIGVGTHGQAPFLMDTLFGKRYVYQPVEIDEETLRQVASTTEAKYYRATDTDELRSIYNEIDQLEKTEVKVKEYTEYNELFHLFLIVALLILFTEIVLANTRLRTIP